jgi:hypothetical protein
MATYQECRETLAAYAYDVIELFADKWERWPNEHASRIIANRLNASIKTWLKFDKTVAQQIEQVRDEIIKRSA